jgi:thioredoxin reductase (NADPH)
LELRGGARILTALRIGCRSTLKKQMSARLLIDCIIVGAGPAGLIGATYLGRFRRSVLVIDDGCSRMKRIPIARNAPGFPDGVSGEELHARMRAQAERYGARFLEARVEQVSDQGDRFILAAGADRVSARTVLIATGTKLVEPDMADLDEAVSRALVRYCPICDGYETRGKTVAVLANRPEATAEALFLRRFADRVLYVGVDANALALGEEVKRARAAGIEIVPEPVSGIALGNNGLRLVFLGGADRCVDALYPCLGAAPQIGLVRELGCVLAEAGGVVTDLHQRTSVAGVYAAGDVLQGLDQIASACGQASIAATAIHNDLRAAEDRVWQ